MDKPIKDHPVAQNGNQKMLPEKDNDEELAITILIVGTGLIAYHFYTFQNRNTRRVLVRYAGRLEKICMK